MLFLLILVLSSCSDLNKSEKSLDDSSQISIRQKGQCWVYETVLSTNESKTGIQDWRPYGECLSLDHCRELFKILGGNDSQIEEMLQKTKCQVEKPE